MWLDSGSLGFDGEVKSTVGVGDVTMAVGRGTRPLMLAAALLFVQAEEAEPSCGSMRTKELRKWLAARGLKCDGCAEKAE